MRLRSLNQGIFRLVIGLVLVTSLTILINVWLITYQQAQNKLNNDIELAQKVLAEVLVNQQALLFTTASVLTDDFGFRQVAATQDPNTIKSTLINHGERISADLMAIYSLEGKVIASTIKEVSQDKRNENVHLQGELEHLQSPMVTQILSQGGKSSYFIVEQRIFKVLFLTVNAPGPVAIGMVGFELDKHFISELESTSQLGITLLANQSPLIANNAAQQQDSQSKQISIRSDDYDNNLARLAVDNLAWYHVVFSSNVLVAQNFSMYSSEQLQLDIVITHSLQGLIAEFSTLKARISVIIFISIVIAFFIAPLYSRKLSKPLVELAEVAKRISLGNYNESIETKEGSKELHDLSTAFVNMQTSIKQREQQISFQAQHDTLSGLYSRYHIGNLIDQTIKTNGPFKNVMQAITINIKNFRDINDVFGYQHGDECLKQLAERIKILGGDAARMSGGEFLWLAQGLKATSNQLISDHQLVEIKQSLEKPIISGQLVINFSLVLGVVDCQQYIKNAEQLFKLNNIVVDEAQLAPSLFLHYKPELEQRYIRRLQIITRLKQALAKHSDDLSLFYQPKLNLKTLKVSSAEALIRWHDSELGFVPPDEFIGIAEDAGLINKVTDWVIERAIQDASDFAQKGLHVCIAINLSAKDLLRPALLSTIGRLLANANLRQDALSFEITESDLVSDANQARESLKEFKLEGYELAIDDFGTGYSSLAYLKSFPVDTLKIDKSFVLKLSQNQDDKDIVETIMQLAKKFELRVVAEGVEDITSLNILADLGCTWAQGFYLCKPIPAQDFIDWCKDNAHTNWLETSE